jgi:PAS domain S-box-containing protein
MNDLQDARKELEAYKSAVDRSAIVATTDADGKITFVNDNFLAISGYSREELIGKTHKVVNSGTHPPEFFREIWDTINAGRVWRGDIRNRAKDGSFYWVATTIVPFLDEKGKPYQHLAIRFEITSRKAAEESLQLAVRENADLRSALDTSAIVATTDANGKITYINDKFVEISKYSRAELMGKTHQVINSRTHSKEFFREMWSTINAGRVWQGDIRNRAKDGSHYWVATTIVPFLDAGGKPYQHLAIRFEITARKTAEEALERAVRELADLSERERQRAEALAEANRQIVEEQGKLIQAEKLASVGLLAAGVAHEINNPLAGVMACVRSLRDGAVQGDRREEYFEAVRDGLERIRATVQGLLDFARPQGQGVTEVECTDIVRSCLLLLAPHLRKNNIQMDLRCEKQPLTLRGNRSQLIQAAMNVLLNAIHASPRGGTIEVDSVREERRVGLSFTDHGAGIPRELLSRVTDPFFTTKDPGQGTGLGLAVTAGILQAHKGELAIQSEEGKGTTVTFWLPRA